MSILKMGHSRPRFFFIFVFSIQLTVNVQYKFCRGQVLNRTPLELQGTAVPTEPQPLPQCRVILPWCWLLMFIIFTFELPFLLSNRRFYWSAILVVKTACLQAKKFTMSVRSTLEMWSYCVLNLLNKQNENIGHPIGYLFGTWKIIENTTNLIH